MMPGKSGSPEASMRRKLSRISCLTDLDAHPLSRSWLSVFGRTVSSITGESPEGYASIRAIRGTSVLYGDTAPGRQSPAAATDLACRRVVVVRWNAISIRAPLPPNPRARIRTTEAPCHERHHHSARDLGYRAYHTGAQENRLALARHHCAREH